MTTQTENKDQTIPMAATSEGTYTSFAAWKDHIDTSLEMALDHAGYTPEQIHSWLDLTPAVRIAVMQLAITLANSGLKTKA